MKLWLVPTERRWWNSSRSNGYTLHLIHSILSIVFREPSPTSFDSLGPPVVLPVYIL